MLLHSGLSLSILIMLTNASRGKSDDRPWEEQEVSAFSSSVFSSLVVWGVLNSPNVAHGADGT